MIRKTTINFLFLLLVCGSSSLSAQDVNTAKKFFSKGEYELALGQLRNLPVMNGDAYGIKAHVHFAQDQFEDALMAIDSHMVKEAKFKNKFLLMKATCLHQKHEFVRAIDLYKAYIQAEKLSEEEYQSVVQEVTRCLAGLNEKIAESENYYLAHPGRTFNSHGNDLLVITSADDLDLYYFSSNRFELGKDESWFRGRTETYDIFYTERINGDWNRAELMNSAVNSPLAERAIGIQDDEILFERKSLEPSSDLFTTSNRFDKNASVSKYEPNWPYKNPEEDKSLNFVTAEMIIFSSKRRGGFGGYDLYYSLLGSEGWSPAINMGPKVNSPFDETYADMDPKSRTLYFSSDRTSSMGGFDLFKSPYDSLLQEWQQVSNMGFPINSAGDDVYFRLGTQEYFGTISSNRMGGQGQLDIYFIYDRKIQKKKELAQSFFVLDITPDKPVVEMKSEVVSAEEILSEEILSEEIPLKVIQSEEKLSEIDTSSTTPAVNEPVVNIPNPSSVNDDVYLSPLFFKALKDLNLPVNARELSTVSEILKSDSSAKVIVQVFTQEGNSKTGDLFYSTKPGISVQQILNSYGISKDRILTQGFGSFYPLVDASTKGPELQKYARDINSHIRLQVISVQQQNIYYKEIDVRPDLRKSEYTELLKKNEGISFRIKLFDDVAQAVHPYLESMPEGMIEPSENGFDYLSGHFKSYKEASIQWKSLQKNGLNYSIPIAYYKGLRIGYEQSIELSKTYPDLIDYLKEIYE